MIVGWFQPAFAFQSSLKLQDSGGQLLHDLPNLKKKTKPENLLFGKTVICNSFTGTKTTDDCQAPDT